MIGSISDCDTSTDRGETPACAECDGDPALTTAYGHCTECGAGICATCQGETVCYERTGVDTEREYACPSCQPEAMTAADYADDRGDREYDCQRDDLLTAREGERHAA